MRLARCAPVVRWTLAAVLGYAVAASGGVARAGGRPMTIDDLLAVKGVSDPQISPDGESVVYLVSELDRATDKTNSSLWLVPAAGGEPRRLTTAPGTNNHPRWSPDGKTIAFVSTRGGSSQIWLLPMEGGEARPLTSLPIDVSGPIWSPKGDRIAFAAEVFPGTTPDQTAAKDKEKAAGKSKVRTFDHLMIRHWSAWDEGKKSHLFVADATTGAARDLTPRLEVNTPPAPFGGSSDYAWSPDGKELAFTAEPVKDTAWSTNTDIWTVPAEGGEPRNVTASNPGADAQPAYSPDGAWLSYVSQARAGFEADLWVLKASKRGGGETLDVSSYLDRPVMSYAWKGGDSIAAVIDSHGTEPIVVFRLREPTESRDRMTGRPVTGGASTSLSIGPGGRQMAFIHHAANVPGEVYLFEEGSPKARALTSHNEPLISQLDLPPAEAFTFEGADHDKVQGWLLRPPGFDPKKNYPVVFLIHGGPQGAWHDEWHGRWNYSMFASPGYVVVAINPRGSTGYGQKFTDQISQDWTGRVYEDLMKGLDHALEHYPFLDRAKLAAAGGSYGGFMVNWICGHTDRFKALISHAGVFDLVSMYGSTEELWFPEWEYGGYPWDRGEHYRERSPSTYARAFRTPTLVIHGALDFRVPDVQGIGMFTCLQRLGVPSRLVYFPDEGHWIAKPPNRIVWWREVQDWLARYLK
ncbi:Prolyl tripeptidyl peptidase precursor [Aquisphaera giovannonii]|uniref:Prolyl tripeptidyl peptidase n=2 Tax=Aquisphaera giovannonii TaxID=406548 RepID=A0A5B9WAE8_9BACT|nr:Prolyl tripeptidyl peptidase precursor [Aquisphaera giovannonii]